MPQSPRAIPTRRSPGSSACECAEVGVGDREVIDVGLPQVLVHRASTTRGSVLFAPTSPTGR
jgi:hypothetical protein